MKDVYALRSELVPRIWVCYELGKKLRLKDEFLGDACSSCGRVSSDVVYAKSSIRVDGLDSQKLPILETEDHYVLYSSKFINAVKKAGVGGLSFVPVGGKTGYSVGWATKLIEVDDSEIKRPRGCCPKCDRPYSAIGCVQLIKKPEDHFFYGIGVEHYTSESAYRYIVCNKAVYEKMSVLGFGHCFQPTETIELLGGSWKRPAR